jgi:hypothetical protein
VHPQKQISPPPWKRCRAGRQPCRDRRRSWPRTPPHSLHLRSRTCSSATHQRISIPYTARSRVSAPKLQTFARHKNSSGLESREEGHPLAVLVIEPAARRGDRESPARGEPDHPRATALPQRPRGWWRGVAVALRCCHRSHLRRLPPESCGHLQETDECQSQRGFKCDYWKLRGADVENLKSSVLSRRRRLWSRGAGLGNSLNARVFCDFDGAEGCWPLLEAKRRRGGAVGKKRDRDCVPLINYLLSDFLKCTEYKFSNHPSRF